MENQVVLLLLVLVENLVNLILVIIKMIKIGTFSLKTRKVSEKLLKNKIFQHFFSFFFR